MMATFERLLSAKREFMVFIAIGAANTVLYFVVYNAGREALSPHVSNALAVTLGILVSFYANRHITYKRRGSQGAGKQFAQFSFVFLLTLMASSIGLWAVFSVSANPSRLVENIALAGASALVIAVRFWLMHTWVFAQDGLQPPLVGDTVAQRIQHHEDPRVGDSH